MNAVFICILLSPSNGIWHKKKREFYVILVFGICSNCCLLELSGTVIQMKHQGHIHQKVFVHCWRNLEKRPDKI